MYMSKRRGAWYLITHDSIYKGSKGGGPSFLVYVEEIGEPGHESSDVQFMFSIQYV